MLRESWPSVSVVIPSYNHGRYLGGCLAALLNQSQAPAEIIVIDDASTDNSFALAKAVALDWARVRVVRGDTNRGVVARLNEGLLSAIGDFVLFAAADDWVLPSLLESSVNLLRENPEAGLCSALTFVADAAGERVRPFHSVVPSVAPTFLPPDAVRVALVRDVSWFLGPTTLVNRRRALELGGFTPDLGSFCDDYLHQQLALRFGACFIPARLAVWRRMNAGYSSATLSDPGKLHAILESTRAAIGKEFEGASEDELWQRWAARWRFAIARSLAVSTPDQSGKLSLAIDRPNTVDELVLWLARRGGRHWRSIYDAYMFGRIRPRDLLPMALRRGRAAILGELGTRKGNV